MKQLNKVEINCTVCGDVHSGVCKTGSKWVIFNVHINNNYQKKDVSGKKEWVQCPCFISVHGFLKKDDTLEIKRDMKLHIAGKLDMEKKKEEGKQFCPLNIQAFKIEPYVDENVQSATANVLNSLPGSKVVESDLPY